jgi:hypothetical protein
MYYISIEVEHLQRLLRTYDFYNYKFDLFKAKDKSFHIVSTLSLKVTV